MCNPPCGPRLFLVQDIQASDKLKTPEHVRDKEPLQDVGLSYAEGCSTKRRLDVIGRPQGCLLLRQLQILKNQVWKQMASFEAEVTHGWSNPRPTVVDQPPGEMEQETNTPI